jgi:hypothetical protein
VFVALGERISPDAARRRRLATWLAVGSVLMPLGFLLGGVKNSESDPSLAILLVPCGGLVLLAALVAAAHAALGGDAGPSGPGQ